MMDWDKVLEYEKDVVEIATKLGKRIDASMIEDAIQNTYLVLHTKVDLSNVHKSEKEYIRGAIWNNVQRFYRDERKHRHISIQELTDSGVQIDEKSNLRWPTADSEYSGNYTEDNE